MDITSAIIGLLSLALFIVPIFYLQGKRKKEQKKLLDYFKRLAEQQQLKISQLDCWNSCYVIGIDQNHSKLLYLKKQEDKELVDLINLSEVEACTVINLNRDVNNNRVIDLIGLRFRFRDPKLAEQALEFYSREESLALNEELVLSEKWKAIITSSLQAMRQRTIPVAG